jgi:hypothetical protein
LNTQILEPVIEGSLACLNQTISVIALPKKEEPKEEEGSRKTKGMLAGMKSGINKFMHKKKQEEKKAPEVVAAGEDEEKKDEGEQLEDLEIVTTDAIVFASNSKFHGDRTIVGDFSPEEADEWFDQQYLVQVCQTKNCKLVLSIRRSSDLDKSIIAV